MLCPFCFECVLRCLVLLWCCCVLWCRVGFDLFRWVFVCVCCSRVMVMFVRGLGLIVLCDLYCIVASRLVSYCRVVYVLYGMVWVCFVSACIVLFCCRVLH